MMAGDEECTIVFDPILASEAHVAMCAGLEEGDTIWQSREPVKVGKECVTLLGIVLLDSESLGVVMYAFNCQEDVPCWVSCEPALDSESHDLIMQGTFCECELVLCCLPEFECVEMCLDDCHAQSGFKVEDCSECIELPTCCIPDPDAPWLVRCENLTLEDCAAAGGYIKPTCGDCEVQCCDVFGGFCGTTTINYCQELGVGEPVLNCADDCPLGCSCCAECHRQGWCYGMTCSTENIITCYDQGADIGASCSTCNGDPNRCCCCAGGGLGCRCVHRGFCLQSEDDCRDVPCPAVTNVGPCPTDASELPGGTIESC